MVAFREPAGIRQLPFASETECHHDHEDATQQRSAEVGLPGQSDGSW